jgi:non-heme chloroperoxidase
MLKRFAIVLAVLVLLVVAFLGSAILFGGPRSPPPLETIRTGVIKRDRSDLPEIRSLVARDGAKLAYRSYAATVADKPNQRSAVLVHGSVGSSADMHEVARALSRAGIDAYAPDIRGHGVSGPHGDIRYIGQLEDDLADLMDHLQGLGMQRRPILIGHSSGGGFALRVAALQLSGRFRGTILLAPYLGPDAPPVKPAGGGWVNVGVPRLIALTILDRLGIRALAGLPVIAFAIDPSAASRLTPNYSFRLMINFAPHRDWQRDIASTRGSLVVLVGADDQLFHVDRFAPTFAGAPNGKVKIVPGSDHMGITGDEAALSAIVSHAQQLLAD